MAGANSGQINESELRRQRKENQAIVQLMMIIGSFLLGYVPMCGKQSCIGFASNSVSLIMCTVLPTIIV